MRDTIHTYLQLKAESWIVRNEFFFAFFSSAREHHPRFFPPATCLILLGFACLLGFSGTASGSTPPPLDSGEQGRALLERGADLLREGRSDSARSCLERAAALLRGTDNEGYLVAVNGIAKALITSGSIQAAEQRLQDAWRDVSGSLKEPNLALATTYASFAYFLTRRDQPDSAAVWNARSLEARRSLLGPDDPLLSENYYTSGLASIQRGQYGEAVREFREALRLSSSSSGGPTPHQAQIRILLGSALTELRRYEDALNALDSSRALLHSLGLERSYSMLSAWVYSAFCRTKSGDLDQARTLYDSAAALAKSGFPDNTTVLSSIRTSMGQVHAQMGDYGRAVEAFTDALERTGTSGEGSASGRATIHHYLARALLEKGDSTAALQHAIKALALRRDLLGPDHPDVASTHELIADVESCRGRRQEALAHVLEAIRIRTTPSSGESASGIAMLRVNTARLLAGMGQEHEATNQLEGILRTERHAARPSTGGLAGAFEALGDIASARGQFVRAAALYDSASSVLGWTPCGEHAASAVPQVDLARARPLLRLLQKKGAALEERLSSVSFTVEDAHQALRTYEDACRVMMSLRTRYESSESTFRLLEQFAESCERGIYAALRLRNLTGEEQWLKTALGFAERNKGGMLLDQLRESRIRAFAGVPGDLLANERKLKTRLTALELELSRMIDRPSSDTAGIRELRWRIQSLREDARLATEAVRNAYPAYAHLADPDTLPVADRLHARLDGRTLLLEYFVGERNAYLFLVGRSLLEVRVLASPAAIAAAAGSFTRSIRMVDYDRFESAARDLSSLLLAPAGDALKHHTRLVIVPDQCLTGVPFEALLREGEIRHGDRTDFSSLPYLVRTHEIVTAPSARLICESGAGEREAERGGAFAGFAPVFRDSTTTGSILASNDYMRMLDTMQLRSISVDGKRFRELPFSDREVVGIAEEFSRRGFPSAAFTGAAASEATFKQHASACTYLHVATHGIVHALDPGRSALLFAQTAADDGEEDGVLYAAEAYNLRLTADLVVLSACESGVGRFVTGEGVFALMRGFLYSGARTIVYSLWQVMDHHTSELMQYFYEGVLDGWRYERALQEAKIRMLASERTAFPFCWAGFVLLEHNLRPVSADHKLPDVEQAAIPSQLPVVQPLR